MQSSPSSPLISPSTSARSKATRLIDDQRGTATVEYLVVMVGVTIGIATAVVAIGPGLVTLFQARVAWLALPIP